MEERRTHTNGNGKKTAALSRRAFIGGSLAAVASAWGLSSCTSSNEQITSADTASGPDIDRKIAIIHTNDTHGHDTGQAPGFSLAAVAQLAHDYEEEGYWVLVLDSGDAIQDTLLVDESKGSTAMDFMNSVGYAAMALGNHEFDWGLDNLKALRTKAAFPFLSANVMADSKNTLVDPNVIFSLDNGANIGIFGLTTPETYTKVSPEKVSGLTFLEGDKLYECARKQTKYLHAQGCRLVICLGHLGYEGSEEPNRSVDVLKNVDGIDIFIDGHDHLVQNETANGTLLAETGCWLQNIGVITYDDGVLAEKLIPYGSYAGIDANTQAIIDQAQADVDAASTAILAQTAFDLDGTRSPGVRGYETNLGDLACDSMLWDAKKAAGSGAVDGAVANAGALRASVPAGPITLRNIKSIFPYDDQIRIVTVTGAQLLEALEASTYQTPQPFSGFPQVAGIQYSIDTTVAWNPGDQYPKSTYHAPAKPGARVKISDVGGKGFSTDALYAIATNDFVAEGGDTYYAFKQAASDRGTVSGNFDYEAFQSFITDSLKGTVADPYSQPQGRIVIG
jgi:5'-nucleotidase/UDP-sugar diphosphatase